MYRIEASVNADAIFSAARGLGFAVNEEEGTISRRGVRIPGLLAGKSIVVGTYDRSTYTVKLDGLLLSGEEIAQFHTEIICYAAIRSLPKALGEHRVIEPSEAPR